MDHIDLERLEYYVLATQQCDVRVESRNGHCGGISPGTAAFDSFASGPATTPTEVVVLEDEFDGATLGSDWIVSNLFSGSTDSTIAVNQANQHLEIGPLPINHTGYNGIRSTARDMTNGYAQVRLVQAASASSTACTPGC